MEFFSSSAMFAVATIWINSALYRQGEYFVSADPAGADTGDASKSAGGGDMLCWFSLFSKPRSLRRRRYFTVSTEDTRAFHNPQLLLSFFCWGSLIGTVVEEFLTEPAGENESLPHFTFERISSE